VLLDDVIVRGHCLGEVAAQLTGDATRLKARSHLDPDLYRGARPREPGWLPCFGQAGAAQGHLERWGVGVGDLFLFFGWFRHVEACQDGWRYRRAADNVHCLFGWLQVGSLYHLDKGEEAPHWAASHPHVRGADGYGSSGSRNTLYVASERLSVPGCAFHASRTAVPSQAEQWFHVKANTLEQSDAVVLVG
jgi:hypothetical protein